MTESISKRIRCDVGYKIIYDPDLDEVFCLSYVPSTLYFLSPLILAHVKLVEEGCLSYNYMAVCYQCKPNYKLKEKICVKDDSLG